MTPASLHPSVSDVLGIVASTGAQCQLHDVAARSGLSAQGLARLLRGHGTSFRRIRDAVRRELAIGWLRGGATVEDVTERLGFSEPSALHRAFRRWTGAPPGTFSAAAPNRRRARNDPPSRARPADRR